MVEYKYTKHKGKNMLVEIKDNAIASDIPQNKKIYIETFRKNFRKLFLSTISGIKVKECTITANNTNILLRYNNKGYHVGSINSFMHYYINVGNDGIYLADKESMAVMDMDGFVKKFIGKVSESAKDNAFRRTGIFENGAYRSTSEKSYTHIEQVLKTLDRNNKPYVTGENNVKFFQESLFLFSPGQEVYSNGSISIFVDREGNFEFMANSSLKKDMYQFLLSDDYSMAVKSYNAILHRKGIYLDKYYSAKRQNPLKNIKYRNYCIPSIPSVYEVYKMGGKADVTGSFMEWISSIDKLIDEQNLIKQGKEREKRKRVLLKINEKIRGNEVYRDIYYFIKCNNEHNIYISASSIIKELRGQKQKNYDTICHTISSSIYKDISKNTITGYIKDMEQCSIINAVEKEGCYGSFVTYYACEEYEWILEKTSPAIEEILQKQSITDDEAYVLMDECASRLQSGENADDVLAKFAESIHCPYRNQQQKAHCFNSGMNVGTP